jgi:MSHA biogenesis protein MshK
MMRANGLGRILVASLATVPVVAAVAEHLADPTRPPSGYERKQEGNAGVAASGPVLQSVIIGPGKTAAIISGQTVRPGEKYGEATVVKITENTVLLRNGKDLQTLTLFPGIEKRMTRSPAGMRPGKQGQ